MIKRISLEEFKALYDFHREFSMHEAQALLDELVKDGYVNLKKSVLTKEILKEKGEVGKTLLKHRHNNNTFLYMGFTRADNLVTDYAKGKYSMHWSDKHIELLEILEESND